MADTEITALAARLRAAFDRIAESADRLEAPVGIAEAAHATVVAERDAARRNSATLEQRALRAETEIARLKEALDAETTANAQLRERNAALKTAKESSQSRADALEATLDSLRAVRDADRAELDSLIAALDPLVKEQPHG